MKKVLRVIMLGSTLFICTGVYGQWHLDKSSIALENGMKKDFTTFKNNLDKNQQYTAYQLDWVNQKAKRLGYYFGGEVSFYFDNKLSIHTGVYNHLITNYALVYMEDIKDFDYGEIIRPYVRYALGFGYKISVNERLSYFPSVRVNYIRTDYDEFDELSWLFSEGEYTHYGLYQLPHDNNNNFQIGIKNVLQWDIVNKLKLNLGIGLNLGLNKFDKIEHGFAALDNIREIYKGESTSRLSFGTIFVGIEYDMWQRDE